MTVLLVIVSYFAVLFAVSRLTARRAEGNDVFYRGERKSPWYMVAWGMIGASVSGVTFVSVPGMVLSQDMTYLQTCLGFILGYAAVAFVLLPAYYRLRQPTIYSLLQERLGTSSYKTGAAFFLLSKMAGTVVKFYLFCLVISSFRFSVFGFQLGFPAVALLSVLLIWLYTRRGGIKTLVWTDSFQTACMLGALLLIIYKVMGELGFGLGDAASAVMADSRSRVFVWDDWLSRQNFWKLFVSGVFIVIVMTGLDQDMMQKNLTCKTLREAQKDMCSYGMAFVPVNLLLLSLGVLLAQLAALRGIPLPTRGDELLPMFAATGQLGAFVVVLFTIGILAASFSTADSALTAMTTSFCVDICERPDDERLRRRVHTGMAVLFALLLIVFHRLNSTSLIDAVYTLVSYTYGPLLGLFAFALIRGRQADNSQFATNTQHPTPGTPQGHWLGYQASWGVDFLKSHSSFLVCIASPIVCYALDRLTTATFGYHFGYELLLLNGLLTFCGLYFAHRLRK